MTNPSRIDRGYVGIPTFLRSTYCPDVETLDAKVAVFGIPFDEGSPFLPGSRFGPRSIREHSLRFSPDGYQDMETGEEFLKGLVRFGGLVDLGDVDIAPTNVEATFDNITAMTRAILARGAMPVALGGDHSVSFPIVRGFDKPLHVIQFDAHVDYEPFENGLRYTNGHAFRHIHAMDHVLSLSQIGIRGVRNYASTLNQIRANGGNIVSVEKYRALGVKEMLKLVPAGAPIYVSIDVDALDMSLVPGCVSGEPDGFTHAELRDALAAVAAHGEIVGFDFVEVNPQLDVGTGATSYLGAHIVMEFLGRIMR